MPLDSLREAEADLAGLPGAIRDKVRAGVAELRRLGDAIDVEIARLTGGAQATLDSLKALAAPETASAATDGASPLAP